MDFVEQQTPNDSELYEFLNNAPKFFREGERIKKFQLKNGDYIHCVLWNYHFYITGTDIVKILVWRFQNANRQLGNMKKFEEGIFSDLRNLKPGIDASLEGPRSDFLEFLYKNGCIRTQKKQKVFYWYSVPHEPLFCDALERDMRRDNSHYNYNGYSHENRQQYSDIASSKSQAYPHIQTPQYYSPVKFESNKLNDKKVDDKSELFNIKSTLFSDFDRSQVLAPHVDSYKGDYSFEKILTPSKIIKPLATTENFDDESKMKHIKTTVGSALKRRFDDFDLDQFGFLRESLDLPLDSESKGFDRTPFSDNTKSQSHIRDDAAKVQFVGGNREDQN